MKEKTRIKRKKLLRYMDTLWSRINKAHTRMNVLEHRLAAVPHIAHGTVVKMPAPNASEYLPMEKTS